MRVSAPLCYRAVTRDNFTYLARREWRTRGSQMRVKKLILPKPVEDHLTAQQRSLEDMFTSTAYQQQLLREIEPGQRFAEKWFAEHLAKEEARKQATVTAQESDKVDTFLFRNESRFTYGLNQAALLTQCHVTQGPPPSVQSIFKSIDLPDSALEMLQRFIFRSHIWQTDEVRLPRRFRPELPIFRHKTEFGIHPESIVRYLLSDLFRYTSLNFSNSNTKASEQQRLISRDHHIDTSYNWCNQRVHFSETHDLMLSGKVSLSPFSSPADSEATTDISLSDIAPVSPLIDLKSTRVRNQRSSDGWSSSAIYHHPHLFSVNLALPNMWSDFLEPEADPVTQDHKNASLLMNCFAQAVATARRLYPDDVIFNSEKLPNPVMTQAVACDGVYFDFVSLQLNTLKFDSIGGVNSVKNQAWVDSGHALFRKTVPKRSMLRNTHYRLLDTETYQRFVSFFLNGDSHVSMKS